jgi:hypothetical protein
MSEDSKSIMLDEESFSCLVRGGVVHSGKIRIALSDIGFERMYEALGRVELGLEEKYKDHIL